MDRGTEAWNNKGIALGNLGKYEEAVKSFEEATRIKADFALAWYNKGIALGNLGKYEEAIISYDEAISIKPDYARKKAIIITIFCSLSCFF
ncbi:MAG: tetratricopeptide repeat protein [Candidatus Nitrosopolaris sp.]